MSYKGYRAQQQIVWKTCSSNTTAAGQICEEIPMVFHQIIHQEALSCQTVSLEDATDIVILTVNYIRCDRTTYQQFQHYVEETETKYGDVYHSAVRQPNRGAIQKRFFSVTIWNKHFSTNEHLHATLWISSLKQNIHKLAGDIQPHKSSDFKTHFIKV